MHGEAFTPQFMAKHTTFGTIEEFLTAIGLSLDEWPGPDGEDALEAHVRETTKFASFHEMDKQAHWEYDRPNS